MGERRISTALSESERLRELLWQSIQSPGLNPATTFLLLATLLEREFPVEASEDLEAKGAAFRRLVESPHEDGGLNLPADRLMRVLADFKHPQEIEPQRDQQMVERMAWMRSRVGQLLKGEIEPAAEHGTNRHTSRHSTTVSRPGRDTAGALVAKLKRDDPALAERVVNGEMSAYAAARSKGWRPPRIQVTTPERTAIQLRKHLPPEQLTELRRLLE
jgi:hypothetical protein